MLNLLTAEHKVDLRPKRPQGSGQDTCFGLYGVGYLQGAGLDDVVA